MFTLILSVYKQGYSGNFHKYHFYKLYTNVRGMEY